jgi:ribosome-associated protein
MSDAAIIEIAKQPIQLDKLLKFEALVGSGGEAKAVISEGLVKVNGAVETRRGKKLVTNDKVEFMGETYIIKEPS